MINSHSFSSRAYFFDNPRRYDSDDDLSRSINSRADRTRWVPTYIFLILLLEYFLVNGIPLAISRLTHHVPHAFSLLSTTPQQATSSWYGSIQRNGTLAAGVASAPQAPSSTAPLLFAHGSVQNHHHHHHNYYSTPQNNNQHHHSNCYSTPQNYYCGSQTYFCTPQN